VGSNVSGPDPVVDLRVATGPRAVAGAVYGTVSVLAVIAGASHVEDSAARVFAFALVSSLVIWTVHIYASVLADSGPAVPWRNAFAAGLRHEIGIVEGVLLPLLILLLGSIGWIEDSSAITWSMWSGVVMLVLIPLLWLRHSGRSWPYCLAAAAACGLLGLGLTWMKFLLH
jgi:hypothetical protein